MKAIVLRTKSVSELKAEIINLKREIFNMRFQMSAGSNVSFARFRMARREIARIKTVLAEFSLKSKEL
jgi:large subunit ribosomal protein L29